MIKLVILDLDGVLIDSKEMHYEALNRALAHINPLYVIGLEEHLLHYDGLSTKRKLGMLHERKGLPKELFDTIEQMKQQFTKDALEHVKPNPELVKTFEQLKALNIKIAVCSNAIRATVLKTLWKLGVAGLGLYVLSNEDVARPKPAAEIFLRACIFNDADPSETLIVEDSPIGRKAAYASGCHVMPVKDAKSWTPDDLFNKIGSLNVKYVDKWSDKNINVVIPMAGLGSRFEQAGYTFPKPLIEVRGKPMIQVVVDNLGIRDANFFFVAQNKHIEKYNLKTMLNLIAPGCSVIGIDGVTAGAACTVLAAELAIDCSTPLLIANSDQFIEWNPAEFYYQMGNDRNIAGGILTFKSTHPKWSFAKVEEGFVTEVAEKKPISDNATVGVYYWKQGRHFVEAAHQMINKDDRTNGEFYVAPTFNHAIASGLKFKTFEVEKMFGLGTPEDLNAFLGEYKGAV